MPCFPTAAAWAVATTPHSCRTCTRRASRRRPQPGNPAETATNCCSWPSADTTDDPAASRYGGTKRRPGAPRAGRRDDRAGAEGHIPFPRIPTGDLPGPMNRMTVHLPGHDPGDGIPAGSRTATGAETPRRSRMISGFRPPTALPSVDRVIELRELTKRYGDRVAVDGLSVRVQPGVVTGFLGPNGSGKSTTMRMILGLDAPDQGQALIGGVPYPELNRPLQTV